MPENPGLDSRAVLGLLAKAHQIFSGADTELSFPLGSPVSFDAASFAAAMGPGPDAIGHALLAEFSTMMNWLPDGVVWPPAEPRTLDEIVRYVLGRATWAVGTRTAEEETRAAAAKALIDLANPVMQSYCARKDAWIRSLEQARNNPDDLVAQEAERDAHTALLACPGREDIEHAMADVVALDDQAPYRTKEEMQRQIDLGTGTFDDPTGGRFSPVRVLPREVIEAPNWDSVTLDRAALDDLAATAPKILTDHLLLEDADESILSISFEYASAQLHRQWFDDRLFALRCWRFDDGRVLSDGMTPPGGDCTSYVRAIVLARNVSVTRTAPTGAPESAQPESMGFLVAEATQATRWHQVLTEAKRWEDQKYFVATVPVEPLAVEPPSGPPVEIRSPAQTLMRSRVLSEAVAENASEAHLEAGPAAVQIASGVRNVALARQSGLLQRMTHLRVSDQLLRETSDVRNFDYVFTPVEATTPPSPAPSEPGSVTVTTAQGQLILLALICKAVGKSPDPEPSYEWQ